MTIVLFSQFGSGYLYLFQRNAIKKEVRKKMEHGIHMDRLVTFDLSELEKDPSFSWEDPIEFHYRNGLYDIVERNGTIAVCYLDIKEKALMDAFNAINAKSATDKTKTKISFEIKLFYQDFFSTFSLDLYSIKNKFSSTTTTCCGFPFKLDSPPDMPNA